MSHEDMLLNKRFCLTGFSPREYSDIAKVIKLNGGTLSDALDTRICCLIVKRVGSMKYIAAQQNNIPCVNIGWLSDSIRCGSILSFSDYRVLPFTGLIIACTQIPENDRVSFQFIVEENGGTHSADLVQNETTHLVALAPLGSKFFHAKKWGHIKIVRPDWIEQCVIQQKWLDEEEFSLAKKPFAETAKKAESNVVEKSSVVQGNALPSPLIELPSLDKIKCQYSNKNGGSSINRLSGEVFFISGFSAEVQDYLLQLVLLCNGRRRCFLSLDVTVILLGDNVSEKVFDACRMHPFNPPIVKLSSLFNYVFNDLSTAKTLEMSPPSNSNGTSALSNRAENSSNLLSIESQLTDSFLENLVAEHPTSTTAFVLPQSVFLSNRIPTLRNQIALSQSLPSGGMMMHETQDLSQRITYDSK